MNEVYRKLGRDEIEFGTTILSQYSKDTGMVMPSELLPGLRGMEDTRGGLPPINAAVANKPWLVRAAANLASTPYWLDLRRVSETLSRVSIWEQIARRDLDDSLKSHGFAEVQDVRIGKLIELKMDTFDEGRVREMCDQLLANTVIESFKFEVVE